MAQNIDTQLFREVLGNYPTGVSAITALLPDGETAAMVVGTFTSVSLDPPLIAFLPTKKSSSFARLRAASRFAVNILAHDQEDLCRRLARSSPDKLDRERWTRSPSGLPLLDGIVAAVECEVVSVTEAGDHFIVLGSVIDLRTLRSTIPLLFFRGGYGGFASGSLIVSGNDDLRLVAAQAQTLRTDLEHVAAALGGEVTVFAHLQEDSVAVASAAAPGIDPITPLGTRHALVPPLGVPLVAWSDEDSQEAWVDRVVDATDEDRALFRRHLEDARVAGWALSLHEPNESGDQDQQEPGDASRSLAPGMRQSRLTRRILRTSRYVDALDLDPAQEYDVGAVMAPVLPVDQSAPTLMVRFLAFPAKRMRGADIERCAHELQRFAALAAEKLVAA